MRDSGHGDAIKVGAMGERQWAMGMDKREEMRGMSVKAEF
jgi:hypothetical protein